MSGSPAHIRREAEVRLTGQLHRGCCGQAEIRPLRPRAGFKECPGCGTVDQILDDGAWVTVLGEKWFEKKGIMIPVDLKIRAEEKV